MGLLARGRSLPELEGFELVVDGPRHVYLACEVAESLRALGFVEGAPATDPETTLAGRAAHPVFALPGREGERVLWKRCRRGGLVHPVLGDRYFSIDRFLEELRTTSAARRAGLGVGEILGLALERGGGGACRVEMACLVAEGTRDLAETLAAGDLPDASRRGLIRAVAEELRRFQGNGFLHGDLNLKNVLWRPARGEDANRGEYEIFLVDLDPGPLRWAPRLRHHNLRRLLRSYLKGARSGRWELDRTDLLRFGLAYFRGDHTGLSEFWRTARRLWTLHRLRYAARFAEPTSRDVD